MRKEERHSQTLQRVFPHARFSEREAADRAQAIEAHRRDLGSRLGRNVGAVVAAVDYMLNISGDLVAPTIVEHKELEQLEHRSITDPLTGLYNRYHFDAALQREIARCRRYGVALSLLLVDIDRLKPLNDRWGHQAGDRALSRVSAAIQRGLRGTDIAARMRRNLVEDGSTMVTLSGGLVELPRELVQGSGTQLMATADVALYSAKKSGGNCVVQGEYPVA